MDHEAPRDEYLVVTTTVPTRAMARQIASSVLGKNLAASVQLAGPIESHYWWQDQLHVAEEYVCACRTRHRLYRALEAEICALHCYETPEVIATSIEGAPTQYLAWLERYATGQPSAG